MPFPLVVLTAAIIGYLAPNAFAHGSHGKAKNDAPALIDAVLAADPGRPARLAAGARRAGYVGLALWLVPVAVLLGTVGGTYADIAWFFSKMAVVTVGGAYAVLAYVAQDAVQSYQWLSAQEMLAGLGLAETTPGPLILVLQFVGFLAGFRAPEALDRGAGRHRRLAAGALGDLCALLRLRLPRRALDRATAGEPGASGALAAITAAVVGVVANLAVWFGLRVLFREVQAVQAGPVTVELPVLTSLDLAALALAILAAVCLFHFKLGVVKTLGIAAGAGLLVRLALGGV